jgi:daunorubicin resistance ABC transporter ATP-binding subunit
MISVEAVRKSFGSTVALAGLDITVERGKVFGLLGRNGAGKTTLVRILATLLRPDSGRVFIAGADVVRRAQTVRALIGYSGQTPAVDNMLTGRENLELVARLCGLRSALARQSADEVLHRLSLTPVADRLVLTYSGGMRRRLDLAASLIGWPVLLILDEPTTGLDPRTRIELWTFIEELVRDGTTVLLTSQYLEEVDRLADRLAVIERGRVIAEGTPEELKQRTGGDVIEVRAERAHDVGRLVRALQGLGSGAPVADIRGQRVTLPTSDRVPTLMAVARRIEERGIAIEDLGVRRPSLDDVFLTLTSQPPNESLGAAR